MSSRIESTWDLRCDSIPRSLSVDIAPSIPQDYQPSLSSGPAFNSSDIETSSSGGGGGVTKIKSTTLSLKNAPAGGTERSSLKNSTSPFDEVFEKNAQEQHYSAIHSTNVSASGHLAITQSSAALPNRLEGVGRSSERTKPRNTNPFADDDDDGVGNDHDEDGAPTAMKYPGSFGTQTSKTVKSGYSVLIGTELGTMQYRTFPTAAQILKNRNAFSSTDTIVSPYGYDGTVSDRIHPLHQPMNIECEEKYPMIACIRARVVDDAVVRDEYTLSPTSQWARSMTARQNIKNSGMMGNNMAKNHTSIYLVLLNDRHSSGSSIQSKTGTGAYSSQIVALNHMTSSSSTIFSSSALPRMSCATYHPNTGFVYAAGMSIRSLPPDVVRSVSMALASSSVGDVGMSDIMVRPRIYYDAVEVLPSEVRSNPDAICATCCGRVIVVACGNTFYAISGTSVPHGTWFTKEEEEHMEEEARTSRSAGVMFGHDGDIVVGDEDEAEEGYGFRKGHDVEKVFKFRQSSQVHPAIAVAVPDNDSTHDGNIGSFEYIASASMDQEVFTSLIFLASGRECAVVEILYNPRLYSNSSNKRSTTVALNTTEDVEPLPSPDVSCGSIVVGPPRHGVATVVSPILSAVGIQLYSKRSGPLMAILTNDGLVQTRSPSCISVPLSTIEVGMSPNDYFVLKALPDKQTVAVSYGGEGRLISFKEDTVKDFSNRMVKLSIDAFGSNGFPRVELAEAVNAKFYATSYVGPEPTNSARTVLRQYLEMVLGLDNHDDFTGTSKIQWLFGSNDEKDNATLVGQNSEDTVVREPHASVLVAATAILCLACSRLSPPNPSLANRAAKSCAEKLGVVSSIQDSAINISTVRLCRKVIEQLLEETKSCTDGASFSTPTRSKCSNRMEFLEAAIWMLRSCGEHVYAIQIAQESFDASLIRQGGSWSRLKYESFLATHLEELWSHGDDSCRDTVLTLPATRQLLETNPLLGLGVFTSSHPKNESQWMSSTSTSLICTDYPRKVMELLKSIRPLVPREKRELADEIEISSFFDTCKDQLPLESGRALTVTYLESLIGISTKKPVTKIETSENVAEMHNELALLLLEGVLSEQSDDESEEESPLGSIYRSKLRRLLGWSNAAVSPDMLMSVLPKGFLRERALVLGQLGRHEDALRILFCHLDSLDLALEYCDARFEKMSSQMTFAVESQGGKGQSKPASCPYLPLISVALKAHGDSDRGIESAVKVMSLRRDKIDRSAALHLLPTNISISSLSQSFLVPALIDSESQARRMEVVASLLRAKYVRLKRALTESQIKSQSSIQTVPGLKPLKLGQPIYTSKSFKARPSSLSPYNFPEVSITKYFFSRYVVMQASIFNCAPQMRDKTLGNVQLVVAESSEEALVPSIHIPIQTLPPGMTGSSWCVLAASPQRLDISAILTCELRYSIVDIDITTGAPLSFDGGLGIPTKSVVEEIQDIEIRRAEFEGLLRLD